MLKQFFGGKPWYESLTAWSVVVLTVGTATVGALCAPGVELVSPETCEVMVSWTAKIAVGMGMLGLRRAATAPDSG